MKKNAPRIFLFLAIAILIGAIGRFAHLRFQSGDLYPAYSTLRADPIGAKALYESLKRLEPRHVLRNVESFQLSSHSPGGTIVFLGMDHGAVLAEQEILRNLARDGGRVLVALDARNSKSDQAARKPPLRTVPALAPPVKGKASTNTNMVAWVGMNQIFGLDVRAFKHTNDLEAVSAKDEASLPKSMPWFGHYYLSGGSNKWETIYEVEDEPVILQQKIGLGSVIICADSYPFSNEALHGRPEPAFLLWALGGGSVQFDETHLGIERGTGVAVLMREFRLHGLVLGCLLVVALWIWRNSAPLVPAAAPVDSTGAESVEGKTAREGIVHLLRRNLKDVEVLNASLEEWAKTHPPKYYWQTVQLEEARKLAQHFAASPKTRSLAATHRKISEHLYPKHT